MPSKPGASAVNHLCVALCYDDPPTPSSRARTWLVFGRTEFAVGSLRRTQPCPFRRAPREMWASLRMVANLSRACQQAQPLWIDRWITFRERIFAILSATMSAKAFRAPVRSPRAQVAWPLAGSDGGAAAVGRDDGAGDVAGLGGGEEGDDLGDLAGLGDPG